MKRPLFSLFTLFSGVTQRLDAAFAFCFRAEVMDGDKAIHDGDGDFSARCPGGGGAGRGFARAPFQVGFACVLRLGVIYHIFQCACFIRIKAKGAVARLGVFVANAVYQAVHGVIVQLGGGWCFYTRACRCH